MEQRTEDLPQVLVDLVEMLARKAGGSRRVRLEVAEELTGHFADALGDFKSKAAREESALKLIESFGDVKMLAKLIKRGKKRCRPLWRKVLSRSLFCLGALIVLFVLYSAWFFTGKPVFSVNYLTKLNDAVRPVALEPDKNAWCDYEEAIDLYVAPEEELAERIRRTAGEAKYVRFSELESAEQAAILEWILRNEQAWARFEAASGKPYCYRKYDVGKPEEEEPMLLAVLLPHLGELRKIAQLGAWRSEKYLADNEPVEAARTCLTLVRVGRQWYEDRATLIEQLVARSIINMAETELLEVIARGNLSVEQTRRLKQELTGIFKDGYPHMTAIAAEHMMFEDAVQWSFTKGGPGGGHIVAKSFAQLGLLTADYEPAVFGLSLLHAGRNRTLQMGEKLYGRMEETIRMSPYEKKTGNVKTAADLLASYNRWRYAFLWAFIPAVERVSTVRYEGKALHEATLTVLALRLHQLEKGTLPDTLDELTQSGYLKSLPDDPFSAGSLVYKRDGDDFVLYSLGEDFDDDNGMQNLDDPWGRRRSGGDRVFWPVKY